MAHDLGFRRLDAVRMGFVGGHATAEACGIAHRYPATVRVSLRTAAQLVEAGAPMTFAERPTTQARLQ